MTSKNYVRPDGSFVATYDELSIPSAEDASPSSVDDLVMLPDGVMPEYADQTWLFPGWSESPSKALQAETVWRIEALAVIARQLQAIEEDEAGATPKDVRPGTKLQWLRFRGDVSNWNETNPGFPDSSKRPVQPT